MPSLDLDRSQPQDERTYSKICRAVTTTLANCGCPAPEAMAPAAIRAIHQQLQGGPITPEALDRILVPPDVLF